MLYSQEFHQICLSYYIKEQQILYRNFFYIINCFIFFHHATQAANENRVNNPTNTTTNDVTGQDE